MANSVILTSEQFAQILADQKSCTIINVIANTEVKMNKTNNPYFGRVTKLSIERMQFGYSYQNAVNNRLDKVGEEKDFIADKLVWGEWLYPNKVITHKGALYMRTYNMKNAEYRCFYMVDGRKATPQEIAEFTPFIQKSSSFSKKQAESGLVENQVKPKNFKFSSLVRITMNKTKYIIVD